MEDIYSVMKNGAEVSKEKVDAFGADLSAIIVNRLAEKRARPFSLRMSNVGRGARQLWYDKKFGREEDLSGQTHLKFTIGDIVESVLLFLADVAGHSVTHSQAEVSLGGIKGHIDAEIDGVTVDVKSASPIAFKKFKYGTLPDNDSFGYIEQISGYAKARNTDAAFLAMEKVTGELAVLPFTQEELSAYKVEDRIEYMKTAVNSKTEPERCYPDEAMGASGNRKLGVNCSYCPHKKRCWADANGGVGLRTFMYANRPEHLTVVKSEPKVYEVPPF